MVKSPDEIKKALECCFYDSAQCADCPYYPTSCDRELVRDAREYIRQLEAERDAAVAELGNSDSPCDFCKHLKKLASETPCNNCVHVLHGEESQFKWRGIQKEE